MLQKYALLEEEKEVVLATDADVLKVKCVKCLWQPSCDTIRCPGESKCVLMKGNCQQCDRVTCVQSQHRQNKERGDKNQRKPENLPENKPQVPCVQCLWNPTCEVVNCPQGTKCHFKAATCHSCAEATCIKDESTPEIA